MANMTLRLWLTVFVGVMFSRAIWGSLLFFMLYAIIGMSYFQNPEVSWERAGTQIGALLLIAFAMTFVVGLANLRSKDKQ